MWISKQQKEFVRGRQIIDLIHQEYLILLQEYVDSFDEDALLVLLVDVEKRLTHAHAGSS
jgi:hypothetical protein